MDCKGDWLNDYYLTSTAIKKTANERMTRRKISNLIIHLIYIYLIYTTLNKLMCMIYSLILNKNPVTLITINIICLQYVKGKTKGGVQPEVCIINVYKIICHRLYVLVSLKVCTILHVYFGTLPPPYCYPCLCCQCWTLLGINLNQDR